jgi:hypothetical protein
LRASGGRDGRRRPLASLGCELLVGSAFISAVVDVFAHAFQFRTYRSRPLLVIYAMVSLVVQDSTCFEPGLGSRNQCALICTSVDILVVADARQDSTAAH